MDELLQTNLFFYITSAAVIVTTVLVCVALYYLVGILRDVREIVARLKRGSETLGEDLSSLRLEITQGKMRLRDLASLGFARMRELIGKKRASRRARAD